MATGLTSSGPARLIGFGEVLTRLATQGRVQLPQAQSLDVHIGGAEANVAAALAALGHRTAMVSALPRGGLGDGAWRALAAAGVDLTRSFRAPGRQGLYFLSPGGSLRASEILYDRAGSAFASRDWSAFDWSAAFEGAEWLHVSGITPALGPDLAAATGAAMTAARAAGLRVSFDGNYRANLWTSWDSDPRTILTGLVRQADLFFANHRDMALLLDHPFSGDGEARRREAALAGFTAFPNLKWIASTARHVETSDCHRLAARIDTPEAGFQTAEVAMPGIIDRIGGGDAFAAGVLHGLLEGASIPRAAELGLALACLKHSVPGDMALFSRADVEGFSGEGADVKR
ncbi:sugar kinase [Sphingomonas sp. NIBR02145]|uniref:sugar kinase n=1 Tax=Sphingomonas sp. NIBR02145 TaxID=3014784 RepID=UPI0022B2C70F|nr:sugar kinase [Sphingomonas sp. NIBR02145]WHU02090.1 sugar kinase [Sphingomonas sp. NIBR02145]